MENKNKKCASVDGDEKFGDYYLSMGTTGRIPSLQGEKTVTLESLEVLSQASQRQSL